MEDEFFNLRLLILLGKGIRVFYFYYYEVYSLMGEIGDKEVS